MNNYSLLRIVESLIFISSLLSNLFLLDRFSLHLINEPEQRCRLCFFVRILSFIINFFRSEITTRLWQNLMSSFINLSLNESTRRRGFFIFLRQVLRGCDKQLLIIGCFKSFLSQLF